MWALQVQHLEQVTLESQLDDSREGLEFEVWQPCVISMSHWRFIIWDCWLTGVNSL